MAQQLTTSKPNSSFTVPANLVLPNLLAWTFPTTGSSVPNVTISQSAAQGLSRAPNMSSDSNATDPPVVPVTSGGTVYYLNPSSGPKLVGGAVPINFPSTAPMTVTGPKLYPLGLLQCLKRNLRLSRYKIWPYCWRPQKKTFYPSRLNITVTLFNGMSGLPSLRVP